jgi:GT2 family glycosyltransferase
VPPAPLTATSDERVRAVQEHLDRVGIRARADASPIPGLVETPRIPDVTTPVSVIIPTIGTRGVIRDVERTLVTETVRSVAARTRHAALEFVVVYDSPTPAAVLHELRDLEAEIGRRIKLVEFTEPFNFSAKCNVGAGHADGEALLLLNDDIEAITDGIVETLIAPLAESGVGATGPKLRFEDGRIQSAGIQYGSGYIRNRYRLTAADDAGEAHELLVSRESTGLTGACLAVRRSVYEEVGGFSEEFPMNYNDVDFGLKVLRHGLRLVWLSDVELYHFESVTRDRTVHPWELERIARRWGDRRQVRERYASVV